MKFFNTTGPINPENHYYVPHRLNEEEIKSLISQSKYFILHAPRQSGKTTSIIDFVKSLNQERNYKALYVNVEPAQAARSNVKNGIESILEELRSSGNLFLDKNDQFFSYVQEALKNVSLSSLRTLFFNWCESSSKPVILFIDEIDSLVGDTLISVLRQLRAGYVDKPKHAPQAVCLVGVRDVRDYLIWSDEQQQSILGGSAFNIKAESLILPDFTPEQTQNLYLQHTQETGQKFTDEAIDYAFYLTQGQPWLVNALAYQACFKDPATTSGIATPNPNITITKEIIERAKEALILRKDTHIDVLLNRLLEPRVRNIVDAVLSGSEEQDFKTDDLSYVRDLGLVTKKGIKIANPIYQEIIPRELTYTKQEGLTQETQWYQNPDRSLNMHKLLEAFTEYFRESSDAWLEKFAYQEAGPHLLLMAFLQRVINGGGKIHREYALGRKRVDLLIAWPHGNQRIVIELKLWRSAKTIPEGLQQTHEYMDINNATEGHLVIFDRRSNKSWDEKIYHRQEQIKAKIIDVWGM